MINSILALTHDELIERAAKWLTYQHAGYYNGEKTWQNSWRHSGCGVVLKEFVTVSSAIPDVIGFTGHRSVVIECKVSRSDFFADQKKPHRDIRNPNQCGNYRYYLTLPSIVCADDIPEGWGLLYAQADKIQVIKAPPLHVEPEIRVAEYTLLYSIARRCQLRGFLKEIQKPLTQEEKEN